MNEKRYFSRINFTAWTQIEFNDNIYEGVCLHVFMWNNRKNKYIKL